VFIRLPARNRRDSNQNFNDIYVPETSTFPSQSRVLMDNDVTKSLQYFRVVLNCLKKVCDENFGGTVGVWFSSRRSDLAVLMCNPMCNQTISFSKVLGWVRLIS